MDSGSEARPSKVALAPLFPSEALVATKSGVFSADLNEDASNYRFNILLTDMAFRLLPKIDAMRLAEPLAPNRDSEAALAIYRLALQRAHHLILQDLPGELQDPRLSSSRSEETPSKPGSAEELPGEQVLDAGVHRLSTGDEAYCRLFLAAVRRLSTEQLQRLAKSLLPWLSSLAENEHSVSVVLFVVDRVPDLRQACEDLCLQLVYKDELPKPAQKILSRLLHSETYSFKVLKLAVSRLSQSKHNSPELISIVIDASNNLGDHVSFDLIHPLLCNALSGPLETESLRLLNLVVGKAAAADLTPIGDRLAPNISGLIDHPVGYQAVIQLIRSEHQGTLSAFEHICKESPVHLFVKKTRKIVFHAYLSLEESPRQTTTLTGVFFAVRRTRSDLRYLLKKEISVCLLVALLCKLGWRIQTHLADLRLRVESICKADPEVSSNPFSSQLLSCLSTLLALGRAAHHQLPAPNATEHQVQTHKYSAYHRTL